MAEMPSEAQVERATLAIDNTIAGDDWSSETIARAVLAAAAPTPEEHERGLEAAAKVLHVHNEYWWGGFIEMADAIVSTYLAATGGSHG